MNVQRVLNKYNLEPKEYEDQIFVEDEKLQEEIVDYANLKDSDRVLEIGAGIGNLTQYIAERCEAVAVEKDSKLAAVLRHQELPAVAILERDVMGLRLENLSFNKIIANMPYSISTPLTFKLLRLDWDLAVLIYQKEFAERIVARPGNMDYSRLSVKMNYLCETEFLRKISSDKLYPEPITDSAVVRLKKVRDDDKDEGFWKVVKACFMHKRKKVKNSLKDSATFLDTEEKDVKEIEDKLPDKRVYQCNFQNFEDIYGSLQGLMP
jgi:16S rRNA (adenine1518-N6/adenine1519-N6)-dimethyltransferase